MCELFVILWKWGKEKKHTKMSLLLFFCVSTKRDLSLLGLRHGGALAVGGVTEALAGGGAHISLRKTSRGKGLFQNAHLHGQGWQLWELNNGRKDGKDYREGQKIAMKNDTEGKFISRGKHCDGLLYCRGNGCGWHRGDRKGLHDNAQ